MSNSGENSEDDRDDDGYDSDMEDQLLDDNYFNEKSKADSTRKNYERKITRLKQWFETNEPSALDESGEVRVPIRGESYKRFIDSLMDPAKVRQETALEFIKNTKKPMGKSTIEGYRSAIIDLHTGKEVI